MYEFFAIPVQYSLEWKMLGKLRRLYNIKKINVTHIPTMLGKSFWKMAINV
jgi:hypothetical protein